MTVQESIKNGHLHPDLVVKLEALQKECKKRKIPIKFSEGFRSVEEQNALYAQGRTKPGKIVTRARGTSYSSQHQWGIAADFYLNFDVDGDGQISDDAFNDAHGHFETVGILAKKFDLGWGGNWSSIQDKPHLYLPKWGSTPATLKSEYGTYENFKKTWNTCSDYVHENGKKYFYGNSKFDIAVLQSSLGVTADGIPGSKTLAATPTLKRGDRSPKEVIIWVQRFLVSRLYDTGGVDGIFGKKTEIAVKCFQKERKLAVVDGIITGGKNTWRCMLGLM